MWVLTTRPMKCWGHSLHFWKTCANLRHISVLVHGCRQRKAFCRTEARDNPPPIRAAEENICSWVWRTKKSVRDFRFLSPCRWGLSLFGDVTRSKLALVYLRFETTCRSHAQRWKGQAVSKAINNYQHAIRTEASSFCSTKRKTGSGFIHVRIVCGTRSFVCGTRSCSGIFIWELFTTYILHTHSFFFTDYSSWILISSLRLAKAVTCSSRNYLVSTTVIALEHNIRQLPCFVSTCNLFQRQLLPL